MASLDDLLAPTEIRARCHEILSLAEAGQLPHFALDLSRLDAVVERVLAVTNATYPSGVIPFHSRWRHFEVAGRDLWADLAAQTDFGSATEWARTRYDLAIISVLLDAGAGPDWRGADAVTGETFARSEGLAVASFRLFDSRTLSMDGRRLRVDAQGLRNLTIETLAASFQVSSENPLTGLEGRLSLLHNLADALDASPATYTVEGVSRPGHLADRLLGEATGDALPAPHILAALLETMSPIWPDGLQAKGTSLGDVGRHPSISRADETDGLIPFHKLSQWLTYSLIEPLEEAGLSITGVNDLTGLPEYRNGGLFLDTGVLMPKDPENWMRTHRVDSSFVVEWRALTVALLDRDAVKIRTRLNKSADDLPLARILQGGTWNAGRQIAAEKRDGGGPPLKLELTGTVF